MDGTLGGRFSFYEQPTLGADAMRLLFFRVERHLVLNCVFPRSSQDFETI